MTDFFKVRLRDLKAEFKVFLTCFLSLAGVSYLTLLASIWIDTEFKVGFIVEGYADMGPFELIHHSFKYLLWFFSVFFFIDLVFLFSSFSQKLKSFLVLITFFLILTDIGSAWLVGKSEVFAYVMYFSGFALALSFLSMFFMIQYDLWMRKA